VLDAAGGQRLPGRGHQISRSSTQHRHGEGDGEALRLRPRRGRSFATVRIVTDTRRDALLVPRGAVVREDSSDFLFVADGDARGAAR